MKNFTKKVKMWQNWKTQNLIKLKNSKCDETQKLQMWQNSECDETQNVTKLKNSKFYSRKVQNVTKHKKTHYVTKFKKMKCDKTE